MTDKLMTLVEDLQDKIDYLTEWEVEFLSSIDDRLLSDRPLSDKQIEKLKQLHEKHVLGW